MTELTRREMLQNLVAASAVSAATGLTPADTAAAAKQPPSPSGGALPGVSSIRERLLFDFDWRFHLGHAQDSSKDFNFGSYQRTYAKSGSNTAACAQLEFDDTTWEAIRLPHDWAVTLPFQTSSGADAGAEEDLNAAHGYKPLGRDYPATSVGWYRRVFNVAGGDASKRTSIEFDGVFRDCIVFCNGHIVGRNESGYSSFRVDVTDFLNYGGANVIAVRVDATLGEGWFYEGAGIYRHVWLVKTDPLHVTQWGIYVRSELRGNKATLIATTEVSNESTAPCRCDILSSIIAPNGQLVSRLPASSIDVPPGATRNVEQRVEIDGPALWSLQQPQLYQLQTALLSGGNACDTVTTRFGIRHLEFDAQRGFLLNGNVVKLKGTCNHQDHAGVGTAIPDRLNEWRIEQLQSSGSNAYRSAHNPPTPELLDACDRLGMLVIDETRIMSSDAEAMSQLERMVRRDRNHPCIILWSLGNEEPQMVSERGARIVTAMKQLVNRLDPSRLCTFAMDKGFGQGVWNVVDVAGFNYRTNQIDEWHDRFPAKPIIGTETGSTVGTRGSYQRDDVKGYVRAYDIDHPWWASTAESWWSYMAARPYIAGGFVWTGFDYRGEPTPFNRWPSISSHFGMLDTCGFPKDNYWYYKAQWTTEPVLHLFPHWNWDTKALSNGVIDIWCHTNLEQVELLVNGDSQGRQAVPRYGHVEWRVKYVAGVIEARGYRNGQLVLTQRRETAGPAAGISLRADRASLHANGEDIGVISVAIVDASGRVVPTASDEVSFAINGPAKLIGVGNGDPISHEADQADRRRAFNGLCMAIVQTDKQAGTIELSAAAPGLKSARVKIESRPTEMRASVS